VFRRAKRERESSQRQGEETSGKGVRWRSTETEGEIRGGWLRVNSKKDWGIHFVSRREGGYKRKLCDFASDILGRMPSVRSKRKINNTKDRRERFGRMGAGRKTGNGITQKRHGTLLMKKDQKKPSEKMKNLAKTENSSKEGEKRPSKKRSKELTKESSTIVGILGLGPSRVLLKPGNKKPLAQVERSFTKPQNGKRSTQAKPHSGRTSFSKTKPKGPKRKSIEKIQGENSTMHHEKEKKKSKGGGLRL